MIECGLNHLGLSHGEGQNLAAVFSAELVANALANANILPPDVVPAECTPKTLESLDFFEKPVQIKLYKG